MDWKKLLQEILAAGWSQAQIGAEIGVKQPTISGLLNGDQTDMRWSIGERLRQLHHRVCEAPELAQAEGQEVA